MTWFCKICKSIMDSKTMIITVTGKRYRVDCHCTESIESDREVYRYQDKNWIQPGGQCYKLHLLKLYAQDYSKKIHEAYGG